MNDAQLEIFSDDILNVLLAAEPNLPGLDLDGIWVGVRSLGHIRAQRDEVLERVEYLQTFGFVKEVAKVISKAHRCWRIADSGRRRLDK